MLTSFTLLLCISILVFSSASAQGVKEGLNYCSDMLIPALFPFMILSTFIVKSGISTRLQNILKPVTKTLFGLPGSTGAIILLSMIGGYPIGARGINTLYEKGEINEIQAQQLLCFCISSGPAFLINVIGQGLYSSMKMGVIILLSQVIGTITVGIISKFFFKSDSNCKNINNKDTYDTDISSALVDSCKDATSGIISLCSFVVLFSALISIIKQSGLDKFITDLLITLGLPANYSASLLYSLLEVTGGSINAFNHGASVEFLVFFLCFAGICVHFQIFSSVKKIAFSKSIFIIFRLLHGLVAAITCHFLLLIFPVACPTFATSQKVLNCSASTTLFQSIAQVSLCICFLLILTPKHIDFCRKK